MAEYDEWFRPEIRAWPRSRALDAAVNELCDTAFALLSDGLRIIRAFENVEEWELVATMALAQSGNAARVAWHAMYVGYYVEALAMGRLIRDYSVLATHVRKNPQEAAKWLTYADSPPARAGELWRQHLSRALEVEARAHRFSTLLNRFAHLDMLGLAMSQIALPNGGFLLRAGPTIEPHSFELTSGFLVQLTALPVDELGRLVLSRDGPRGYLSGVATYVERAERWLTQ